MRNRKERKQRTGELEEGRGSFIKVLGANFQLERDERWRSLNVAKIVEELAGISLTDEMPMSSSGVPPYWARDSWAVSRGIAAQAETLANGFGCLAVNVGRFPIQIEDSRLFGPLFIKFPGMVRLTAASMSNSSLSALDICYDPAPAHPYVKVSTRLLNPDGSSCHGTRQLIDELGLHGHSSAGRIAGITSGFLDAQNIRSSV